MGDDEFNYSVAADGNKAAKAKKAPHTRHSSPANLISPFIPKRPHLNLGRPSPLSSSRKTDPPICLSLSPPFPFFPRSDLPQHARAMVEGHVQTWTTRRGSNPRLESEQVIDFPATPTSEVRNSINATLSPTLSTVVIIASWYFSNIGVLLNKYLLSFYGYRYPIFLTLLHMLSTPSTPS